MKRKNKKDVIRVGDKVRIVIPKLFIRCGYPLNKEIVKEASLNRYDVEVLIYKLILDVTSPKNSNSGIVNPDIFSLTNKSSIEDTMEEIKDALAFHILKKEKWGGSERQIFEKENKALYFAEGTVIGKKYHKVGSRIPGGAAGFYGEDYDPPILMNERTKTILSIDVDRYRTYVSSFHDVIRINSENVVKINEFSPERDDGIPF